MVPPGHPCVDRQVAGETVTPESDIGRGATVLVDATSLNRRMKGVGRYTWYLCQALSQDLPENARLVLVSFQGDLPAFPQGFRGQWKRLPYRSEFRLGLQCFPQLIRDTGAGVFIRPADKIGWRYSVPTLTVCHDINPLIWAAQPSRSWRRKAIEWIWEFFRGRALRQSDLVICNSEFIRKAAVQRFGLLPEKTSVGYCGVDRRIPELAGQADRSAVRERVGAECFLLAFATGDEREGFRILPELLASARKAGYPGKLVVAGMNYAADYARELQRDFSSKGVSDSVCFFPFLGEERLIDLAGLYGSADFYLETSKHEGFGMQLVEAMACGTTCFSSGRGALAEIGRDFPLPLDIDSPTAAGQAVAAAWQTGQHRRDNAAQVAHALSFDWDDTCNQVVRFAREHLKGAAR
jgi:glycosyltransferase involved in cell wall biosynthesis